MQAKIQNGIRRARVMARKLTGREPTIALDTRLPLESHGSAYGGWCIPANSLKPSSIVIDVGLGEGISFSTSLIDQYGMTVHGFDPTPRSIAYVEAHAHPGFILHKFGIGERTSKVTFYLPNDERNVSGSYKAAEHVGRTAIEVELLQLDDLMSRVGTERIDLLKLDVEGAEYDVFASEAFRKVADRIDIICVEFHHRWRNFGVDETIKAVDELRGLGFRCVWRSPTTNEEFTFAKVAGASAERP